MADLGERIAAAEEAREAPPVADEVSVGRAYDTLYREALAREEADAPTVPVDIRGGDELSLASSFTLTESPSSRAWAEGAAEALREQSWAEDVAAEDAYEEEPDEDEGEFSDDAREPGYDEEPDDFADEDTLSPENYEALADAAERLGYDEETADAAAEVFEEALAEARAQGLSDSEIGAALEAAGVTDEEIVAWALSVLAAEEG
jgi:hypothetical protein